MRIKVRTVKRGGGTIMLSGLLFISWDIKKKIPQVQLQALQVTSLTSVKVK